MSSTPMKQTLRHPYQAYLQGLLGGGPAQAIEVAGHTVEIQAAPTGLYRGSVAAKVSF